jgi:hypothetical protein
MAFQQYPQKLGIPSGNTAARPAGAVLGDTFYNGQLGLLEIYDGTNWIPCSSPAAIPSVSAVDVGTSRAYGSGAINYTFTPGTNGGSPYGYVGFAVIGATTYSTGATTSSTPTLVVGDAGTYSVSGSAYNGFGSSPTSVAANLAVTTVPQAPTIGSVTTAGNVVVNWTLNSNGGKALTSIKVNAYSGATLVSTTTAATTTSTSATITGLTSGTAYTFKVFASNANGDGLESSASASVTPITLDYLVVAGGASGGGHQAGGGGAGGLRSSVTATGGGGTLESPIQTGSGSTFTITVGNGGASVSGSTNAQGNPGGISSIAATGFTTISTVGGGGGGGYQNVSTGGLGASGGSGGGGGSGGSGTQPAAAGTANQGYAGGIGYLPSPHGGGGGGGAGQVGANANQSGTGEGGNGGNGVAVSITGTSVTRAGGGGGSGWGPSSIATPGSGGAGGGGRGGNSPGGIGGDGVAGTANTGGGGGGSGQSGYASGAGGSGVVIVRALIAAASTTGSPTYTTSGSFHIYQFNGNGSITY